MPLRAVLIADVRGSSSLAESARRQLDADLRTLFRRLNTDYHDQLTGNFDFSLGDEFQAVFAEPAFSVRPILLMHSWLASQAKSAPIRVRSSVGIGPVFVAQSRITRKQDGPAFHAARNQIQRLHDRGQSLAFAYTDMTGSIKFANQSLEIGCRFIDTLWNDWTAPQWEAAYWKWTGKTSRQVAEVLEVRPQNISKRLQSARFSLVDETMSEFESILRDPILNEDDAETPRRTIGRKTRRSPSKG